MISEGVQELSESEVMRGAIVVAAFEVVAQWRADRRLLTEAETSLVEAVDAWNARCEAGDG
jgi:hypothetical protein